MLVKTYEFETCKTEPTKICKDCGDCGHEKVATLDEMAEALELYREAKVAYKKYQLETCGEVGKLIIERAQKLASADSVNWDGLPLDEKYRYEVLSVEMLIKENVLTANGNLNK